MTEGGEYSTHPVPIGEPVPLDEPELEPDDEPEVEPDEEPELDPEDDPEPDPDEEPDPLLLVLPVLQLDEVTLRPLAALKFVASVE
jgi:hypothetical protein